MGTASPASKNSTRKCERKESETNGKPEKKQTLFRMEQISATPSVGRLAAVHLTPSENAVFQYIRELIGVGRIPVAVPRFVVCQKLGLKNYQVGYVMKKLWKKGMLERWVSYKMGKDGMIRKVTYYRLPIEKTP